MFHREKNALSELFDVLRTQYYTYTSVGGGGIAQLLASLSTKRAVRVRAGLDPLVTQR